MSSTKPLGMPILTYLSVNMELTSLRSITHSFWQPNICDGGPKVDIMYTLGMVSRFMSNLKKKHWKVVKDIIRYLNNTRKQDFNVWRG